MAAIRSFTVVSALLLLAGLIGGCGNEGAGNHVANNGGVAVSTTKNVLLSIALKDATTRVGSINVTMELPDGVTVAADATGAIPQSSLFLSGEGATFAATPNTTAILIGKFTPASQAAKGKVSIAFSGLVNSGGTASGLPQGVFAALVCQLATDVSFPSTTILPLSGIDIADSLGTLPHLSDTVPPAAWITYQIP